MWCAAGASAQDEDEPVGCEPSGSITLLRNQVGLVFAQGPTFDGHATTYACAFQTDQAFEIDSPRDAYAYRPPAMAIAGPIVAYGLDATSIDTSPSTTIEILDVRLGPNQPPETPTMRTSFAARVNSDPQSKVGSVVVKANRAVAWIACPSLNEPVDGRRAPTCVRSGYRDEVYKADAGDRKPQRLDIGNSIDPDSLRLRGSKLSWLRDGNKRTARLK